MSQMNSNIKDDFQVVLLLSCFVGHPVYPSPGGGIQPNYLNFFIQFGYSQMLDVIWVWWDNLLDWVWDGWNISWIGYGMDVIWVQQEYGLDGI